MHRTKWQLSQRPWLMHFSEKFLCETELVLSDHYPVLTTKFNVLTQELWKLSLFLSVSILPLCICLMLFFCPHIWLSTRIWNSTLEIISLRLSKSCSIVVQDAMWLLRSLKTFWFLLLSRCLVVSGNLQDLLFIPTFWNLTMMCLDMNLFSSIGLAFGGLFPSGNVYSSMLGNICQLLHWAFPLSTSFVWSYYLHVHPPRPAILNHSPTLIFRFFFFLPIFLIFCLYFLVFCWILHFYSHF